MTGWDYVAGINCILAASFLVIHAVMVGNPDYGWQPRSFVVRTIMVIAALFLGARGYTVFQMQSGVELVGQLCIASLALLFFVSWMDMMVASWKREIAEERDTALTKTAKVVQLVGRRAARAETNAGAAAAQSGQNAERLERIEAAVAILEPAPYEFKDQIGYKPGT